MPPPLTNRFDSAAFSKVRSGANGLVSSISRAGAILKNPKIELRHKHKVSH